MRIPLAVNLESRDGQRDPRSEVTALPRDGRIINGIVEVKGERAFVRKRPGLVNLGQIDSGVGQLLYNWNGIRAIIDDTVSIGTVTSIISAPTQDALTTSVADLQMSGANTGSGVATPLWMFKNRTKAWTMNRAGTVSAVTYGGTMGSETFAITTLSRAGGVATAVMADSIPFDVGDSVTIAGCTGGTAAAYNITADITSITEGSIVPARNIPITITRSTTTATATTVGGVPHGLTTATAYTISGANQSAYNGSKTITVTSASTFTYTVTESAMTTPATGTPAIASAAFPYSWGVDNYTGSDRTQFRLTYETLEDGSYGMAVGASITFTDAGLASYGIVGPYTVTAINSDGGSLGAVFTVPGFTGYVTTAVPPGTITQASVSSITYAVTTATLTTGANHNLKTGNSITVSGADQGGYNGTFTITRTGPTTFTYPISVVTSPDTPATGSIIVTDPATTGPSSFTYAIAAGADTAAGAPTVTGTGGTVPGIGYLNGYFVVMDTAGTIWNSASDDPTTWGALDFLVAQNDSSKGMGIAVNRGYLIAFKEWSTEFFYDAGNASGSPLSPVDSGTVQTGCANGWSIASIDDLTFWMSQTKAKGRGVHVLTGLETKKVSTPDIDRILDDTNIDLVYSFCLKIDGHTLYVLTIATDLALSTDEGITLVYDSTVDLWYEWTTYETTASVVNASTLTRSGDVATFNTSVTNLHDGMWVKISGATQTEYNGLKQIYDVGAGAFKFKVDGSPATPATTGSTITANYSVPVRLQFVSSISFGDSVLLLHEDGWLFSLEDEVFTDDGSGYYAFGIDFVIRTPRLDLGTLDRKTLSSLSVVGTNVDDSAMIRWSDDDYQTVSDFRPVDLSTDEPELRRCGAFKRRSFEIKHTGNSSPIFEALELKIGK